MKALDYIKEEGKRVVWLRAFHIWQYRPHEVAPLSDEVHECASCGTTFTGNFCPRCGQSAKVGRFSFIKAFLLFIDVWGIGNRGMFRSIRDLMFRPGYMIRDYLSGMQSAYFPPFKMFFLLIAFSLIVEHGFSLGLDENEKKDAIPAIPENVVKAEKAGMPEGVTELNKVEGIENDSMEMEGMNMSMNNGDVHLKVHGKEIESPMYEKGVFFAKYMNMLRKKYPAIFALITLVLVSLPLYFFVRHKAPTIPDLRYSEFLVALVYTSNTYSIYSIAGILLNSAILKTIAVLMVFVAMKQFSGFSKRRLLGYLVLTFLISAVVLTVVVGIGVYITYLSVRP